MKTAAKVTLIIGLSLILVGFILFIVAVAAGVSPQNAFDLLENRRTGSNTGQNSGKDVVEQIIASESENIAALSFDFDAADARITGSIGNIFTIQAEKRIYTAEVKSGTLHITPREQWFRQLPFGSGTGREAAVLYITVPAGYRFDRIDIQSGAGRISMDAPVSCITGSISIGAGSCDISELTVTKKLNIDCGMGSIDLNGKISGTTEIQCGMGEINLCTTGQPEDYAYTAEVGMGSIQINDTRISGIGGKTVSPYAAKNMFDITCGMGSVTVSISE